MNGVGFSSNFRGHVCSFPSLVDYLAAGGSSSSVSSLLRLPPGTIYDGNCPSTITNGVTVTIPANGGFSGSSNIPSPPASASYVSSVQELSNWASSTGAASQCPDGVASSTCDPGAPSTAPSSNTSQTHSPCREATEFQVSSSWIKAPPMRRHFGATPY